MAQKKYTREDKERGIGVRGTFRLYEDEWANLRAIADERFGANTHTALRRALLLLDIVYGVEVELPADLAFQELKGNVDERDKAKAALVVAAGRISAEAGG